MAITWRNIQNMSGYNVAARFAEQGTAAITRGLDRIADAGNEILQDNEDANTQAFQTSLSKYRTPDELEQAQKSGEIDSLLSQYNGQVDDEVALNGVDDRIQSLRSSIVADREFENSELGAKAKPLFDKWRAAAISDDKETLAVMRENGDYATLEQYGLADDAEESIINQNNRRTKEEEQLKISQDRTRTRDTVIKAAETTEATNDLFKQYSLKGVEDQAEYDKKVADLGVSLQVLDPATGEVNTSATKEQVQAFKDGSALLKQERPNLDDRVIALKKDLLGVEGITPDILTNLVNKFTTSQDQDFNRLSEQSKYEMTERQGQIDLDTDIKNNTLRTLLQDDFVATEAVAAALEPHVSNEESEIAKSFADGNGGKITSLLTEAVSTGIATGKGRELKKFSPSMINNILIDYKAPGFGGDDPETLIRQALVEYSETEDYKTQVNNLNTWVNESDRLEREYKDPGRDAAIESVIGTWREANPEAPKPVPEDIDFSAYTNVSTEEIANNINSGATGQARESLVGQGAPQNTDSRQNSSSPVAPGATGIVGALMFQQANTINENRKTVVNAGKNVLADINEDIEVRKNGIDKIDHYLKTNKRLNNATEADLIAWINANKRSKRSSELKKAKEALARKQNNKKS